MPSLPGKSSFRPPQAVGQISPEDAHWERKIISAMGLLFLLLVSITH
ncbi:hypothetical protein MCEMSE6_00601 [Oxalobacteraceae bacterium]